MYASQCRAVNEMIKTAKEIYFSSVIDDNKGDQCVLFTSIDTLLYHKPVSRYPSCTSDEVLANRFNSFFLEKINTIHSSIIGSCDANILCPPLDASFSKCELLCFQPVIQDQVSKIIKSSTIKSCDLDPFSSRYVEGMLAGDSSSHY